MMHTLGLAMIVKNEEKNLPSLLETIGNVFDQIVVVDTGSTDSTLRILEESSLPITIIKEDWHEDFSRARNLSFHFMKTDLICWLDADDRLPAETAIFLRTLKTQKDLSSGYLFKYEYSFSHVKSKPYLITNRLNVVQRSKNPFWLYPIYEQLIIKGDITETNLSLYHSVDAEEVERKNQRNRKILIDMLDQDPESEHALIFMASMSLSENKLEESLKYLQQLLTFHPENNVARTQLLQLAYEVKNENLFTRFYQQDLEKIQDFADLSFLKGYHYELSGNLDLAKESYELALQETSFFNYFLNRERFHLIARTWPIKRLLAISREANDLESLRKYKLIHLQVTLEKQANS